MAQVINTNVLSLTAQRNLNSTQNLLQTSIQRLSSGLRINSAKDDAAGLAISERFTAQIRGLNQAQRNANDGISFAQTAEGALSTIGNNLQRIRELAVQSANDTNSATDRASLNSEVQQLIAEMGRVAGATQFNGQNILDGSLANLVFQVGANAGQTITVTGVDARTDQLGLQKTSGSAFVYPTATPPTDLTINGEAVDLAGVTDVAGTLTAINALSATTGVTASQATSNSVNLGGITIPAAATGTAPANTVTLEINGQTITITGSAEATAPGGLVAADDLASVVAKINAVSSDTGVAASIDGTNLVLSNLDGSDITLEQSAATFSGLTGTDEQVFSSAIVLTSAPGSTVTVGGAGAAALGLGTVTTTNETVDQIDILTRQSAGETLAVVDAALDQINSLRATLGAVQGRFENVITNLAISAENLSTARSRIRDADFAAEIAQLTQAQVLQQAGISALAQANAAPQAVLALLQ